MTAWIFGLPIEGLHRDTIIDIIRHSTTSQWLVTANPEILLEAKRNPLYSSAVKKASFRLVDGMGLALACRLKGSKVTRVTGVELSESLLQLAQEMRWRVALVGSESQEAMQKLIRDVRAAYPDISVMGELAGKVDEKGIGDLANEEASMRLSQFDPYIVLVAFGHPKQELWIEQHKSDYPSLKAIMGVGGTFDYWSGAVKRAPRWMRQVGLEWLWRVFIEPKRIKRIFDAVILFPIHVLLSK